MSRLGPTGVIQLLTDIKNWVITKLSTATVAKSRGLPTGTVNEATSTATLTVTLSDVTELYAGLAICIRSPFNNVASSTLNVNELGAKPIYYQNNTTTKDCMIANAYYILIYDTVTNAEGCWKIVHSLNTNTDTLVAQNVSTTNKTYPVLVGATADATSNIGNKATLFAKGVKINPSTNVVSASGFSGPLTGNVTGNASSATEFSATTTVALTGDATGTSAGSKKGWSVPVTLANSGVTAGSYGPSANASPSHGGTFSVPYVTVDAKGRTTAASTKTITLPTYSTFTGASSSAAGSTGLVVAPAKGDQAKFLRGDATWQTISIPTVNNATLTIQKNGTTVNTFTANASSNVTANITVPTKVSDLTNDSGYLVSSDLSTYATKQDLADLVDSAPEALDTLNELSAALGDDPNFATTIATTIGTKADDSAVVHNTGNETIAGTKTFSSTITGSISGNAGTATQFSANKSVTLTGDVTGTASSKAGWSVATTLANSGVTAGDYGPSADASPAHSGTFTVPSITVDAKGRVTAASTKTITLPADSNTDTKVTQAYSTTNNSYPVLFSATAGVTSTSSRGATTSIVNNGIYANPSTGSLYATKLYSGGNAVLTAHPAITTNTDTTSTASPAHSGTFTCIDSVTRDSNGHVTKVNTKTITLPADNNTDTLVTQNVSTTNSTYPILLCATANATSNQGAKTSIFGSGVKVNPHTSTVTATTFSGSLSGTADKATKDASGNVITSTYATISDMTEMTAAEVTAISAEILT